MTAIIAYQNWIDSSATTTATSTNPNLSTASLITPQLSDKWRGPSDSSQTISSVWDDVRDVQMIALLDHNVTSDATITVQYLNSGDVWTSATVTTFHESATLNPSLPRSFIWPLAAAVSAKGVRVTISDTSHPDGVLQAGRFWAGPSWSFSAFKKGFNLAMAEDGSAIESKGGQGYGRAIGVRRKLSVSLNYLDQADAIGDVADPDAESFYRLQMAVGTTEHYLIIPRDTDALQIHRLGLYGRNVRDISPVHIRASFWKVAFDVIENR